MAAKKTSTHKGVCKIKQNHPPNTRKIQTWKKAQRNQLMPKTNKSWGGKVRETYPVLAKLMLKPEKVQPPLCITRDLPLTNQLSNAGKINSLFKNKHPNPLYNSASSTCPSHAGPPYSFIQFQAISFPVSLELCTYSKTV